MIGKTLRFGTTTLRSDPKWMRGLRPSVLAMVLAVASPGVADADNARTGFYTGRIINPQVRNVDLAVSLCFTGSAVTGSYVDLDAWTDIQLRGSVAESRRLELDEINATGVVTARWNGEINAYGGFRGARTPVKGIVDIFETRRTGAIPADSPPRGSGVQPPCSEIGYQMARTGRLRSFRRDEKSAAAWFPRLVRFRDEKIMARVNAALGEASSSWFDELRERAMASNCENPPSRRPEDAAHHYEVEVGVEYASHDIFSIRVFGEFGCDERFSTDEVFDGSLTYDLRTGEHVSIDALFKEGMAWEKVIPLLFPYQLAEATKPNAEECWLAYKDLPSFGVGFHLAADGLVVAPIDLDFLQDPRNYCWRETVVPFALLRAAARPGSVLERAAAAAPADAPVRYRIRDSYRDDGLLFTLQASRP
jgi:hypothetical protein